ASDFALRRDVGAAYHFDGGSCCFTAPIGDGSQGCVCCVSRSLPLPTPQPSPLFLRGQFLETTETSHASIGCKVCKASTPKAICRWRTTLLCRRGTIPFR